MATMELVFRAEKLPDGSYRGTVNIPALPGAALPGLLPDGTRPTGLTATAKGPSKQSAVTRAAALADKALSNPMVQAALPPQAVVALKAAKTAFKVGKKLRKLF